MKKDKLSWQNEWNRSFRGSAGEISNLTEADTELGREKHHQKIDTMSALLDASPNTMAEYRQIIHGRPSDPVVAEAV